MDARDQWLSSSQCHGNNPEPFEEVVTPEANREEAANLFIIDLLELFVALADRKER